jgi:hypothetical protein
MEPGIRRVRLKNESVPQQERFGNIATDIRKGRAGLRVRGSYSLSLRRAPCGRKNMRIDARVPNMPRDVSLQRQYEFFLLFILVQMHIYIKIFYKYEGVLISP